MQAIRHTLPLWIGALAASACAGLFYHALFGIGTPMHSIVYGVLIGTPVIAYEVGAILPRLQAAIQRLPTIAAILAAEFVYAILIILGHAAAGILLTATGAVPLPMLEAAAPSGRVVLYALAVSAVIVSVMRIRQLIGSEVFLSFLIGRYHRPVREERIFLFIDLVGSTRFAEREGDLRAQEWLGAFFAAIAAPIREHGGAIADYVGDMALVTWPMRRGLKDAAAIRCVFAIEDAIARDEAVWRRRFGEAPRFRAALHAGSVVTAEIGVDRHKITYFGDAVNTTSRLEALAKTLDVPVLASADLVACAGALPDGIVARTLGRHVLKGREQEIEVFAIERGSVAAVVPRAAAATLREPAAVPAEAARWASR